MLSLYNNYIYNFLNREYNNNNDIKFNISYIYTIYRLYIYR
jgi:5-methylcytosine-specific restriction endonuclease McrBC regulatory subunit McrC